MPKQRRRLAAADQRLCFRYMDSTISYLNSKFQASSHLLWVYNLVCVRPGRKPQRPVFSQRGSNDPHCYLYQNAKSTIILSFLLFVIMPIEEFTYSVQCIVFHHIYQFRAMSRENLLSDILTRNCTTTGPPPGGG